MFTEDWGTTPKFWSYLNWPWTVLFGDLEQRFWRGKQKTVRLRKTYNKSILVSRRCTKLLPTTFKRHKKANLESFGPSKLQTKWTLRMVRWLFWNNWIYTLATQNLCWVLLLRKLVTVVCFCKHCDSLSGWTCCVRGWFQAFESVQ
jgi:hypothetical protein